MQTFLIFFPKFVEENLHHRRIQIRQFQHKVLARQRFNQAKQITILPFYFPTNQRADAFPRDSSPMDGQQADSGFVLHPQAHPLIVRAAVTDYVFAGGGEGVLEFLYGGFVFFGLRGRGLFSFASNLYLTRLCTAR